MSFVWRLLDPVLLLIRSRLEHLAEAEPSERLVGRSRGGAIVHATARLLPQAEIENRGEKSRISVGPFAVIGGQLLTLRPEAKIEVGDHSFLGTDSKIWAQESVRIGSNVLIAHLVDIHDSNAHSLLWTDRRDDAKRELEREELMDWSKVACSPVVIEDDVWIGFKSSVFKGVTIGRGAVVAACSVVTKSVPPFTLVAGNPAKVIRQLEPGECEEQKSSTVGMLREEGNLR